MLDLIGSMLLVLLPFFGKSSPELQPLPLLSWQDTSIFRIPTTGRDLISEAIIVDYLKNLASQGNNLEQQGIWVQSDWSKLADNRGKEPLAAASLTKVATTLAALGKWEANYQFETRIYSLGTINNGILTGDLIIEGSGDPLLVWEEAIALGNALNQLGIRQVSGNLVVTDKFYLNYRSEPKMAGKLFKQAVDRQLWQKEITQQYLQLPPLTPQPEVAIAGTVELSSQIPSRAKLLLRQKSLPLAEILRQMNIYSNNQMSEILANLLGGAAKVSQYAAQVTNIPQQEIQLVNGSGLGEDNRLSPRAVSQMLIATERLLRPHNLSVVDLFPVAGRDLVGTIQGRNIPQGTTVKTGTLDRVSALAGVIPTRDRGLVWFTIINNGSQVEDFRQQQDLLLNRLVQNWQLNDASFDIARQPDWYLGDPRRIFMMQY